MLKKTIFQIMILQHKNSIILGRGPFFRWNPLTIIRILCVLKFWKGSTTFWGQSYEECNEEISAILQLFRIWSVALFVKMSDSLLSRLVRLDSGSNKYILPHLVLERFTLFASAPRSFAHAARPIFAFTFCMWCCDISESRKAADYYINVRFLTMR